MYRRFAFYNPFTFFNAEELKDAWPYMGRMELDIKKSFKRAELFWLNTFIQ
jgi:hypothetical protein